MYVGKIKKYFPNFIDKKYFIKYEFLLFVCYPLHFYTQNKLKKK